MTTRAAVSKTGTAVTVITDTKKKRARPSSRDDELAKEGGQPSDKSPKLSIGSLPGKVTETPNDEPVDVEVARLKFPYTVEQIGRPKGDGDSAELELSQLLITFEMSTKDIELKLRDSMKSEEDDGYAVDENGEIVDDEEIDLDAFEFYHFDQFKSFYEPEKCIEVGEACDEEDFDDDDDDDDTPATSADSVEDAWFKSIGMNGLQKTFMEFDTSACRTRSIVLKFSDGDDGSLKDGSYLKFKVRFTDGYVTEHMAVSAMEQVLRQQAPHSLRLLLKSFVETNRLNCSEMKKRYNYIYNFKLPRTHARTHGPGSYVHSDILIGDFLPFDSDEHNAIYIKPKLCPEFLAGVGRGKGGRMQLGSLAIDVVRDRYMDGSNVSDYDDSSESEGEADFLMEDD